MAKDTRTTKNNKTYDIEKGAAWSRQNPAANALNKAYMSTEDYYAATMSGSNFKNFKLPETKMVSLKSTEVRDALEYYINNKDKVPQKDLENKLLDIMGGKYNADNKLAYIELAIDMNADKLGYDSRPNSSQYYTQNKDGTYSEKTQEELSQEIAIKKESESGIDYYRQLIDNNLMTDPYSSRANQFKQDMYGSINAYEQASQNTLASAELDAYKMLGQQQLQLESEIANQRMTALKSGTTSAQLATQQLANMFAAQSAAQQTAASMAQQRATMADQYNQQRAGVVGSLYDMTSNQALTAANAYAQLGAAQASYNSYINQPYAQYQAAMQAYMQNPSAFKATMTAYTDQNN